ncbi:rna-directed dna polymerase from mobile element hypothetical protein [Limosa lapponica baueri]|uniref:Rna-directed dna polymerase from mobile element jockey-like n=1 Tax=Limosa lapponica baueri TaxID=1758121 RepID=A0A2I0UN50_LIMLA|nr:rna-directed dna polymerase from mobile element hypothetical protein [Limosa lapponica baueri]
MGPNGMCPQMLRKPGDVLAKPFSIIFERSSRTREISEDWRKVNVTSVFKKGKKEDPGNYRPVSLNSIPGKVMKQLILDVISKDDWAIFAQSGVFSVCLLLSCAASHILWAHTALDKKSKYA